MAWYRLVRVSRGHRKTEGYAHKTHARKFADDANCHAKKRGLKYRYHIVKA